MFGIEAARTFTDLQRTISNAIKRLLGRIEALEARPAGTVTSVSEPAIVPIGSVIAWTSGTSLPIGYLECDGSAISRTTYSQLFAIIGTTFGTGDGSTTFNLPNGQGLVLRGEGTQDVNGRTKDGGTLGDVQEDQMQKITGQITGENGYRNASGTASGALADTVFTNNSNTGGSSRGVQEIYFDSSNSPDARTSDTTEGETQVSSLSIIWIIRAQNLETATATESAVDSLNSRVSDVEAQLPPPITAITGLSDFIKVGTLTMTAGTGTQSFNFPTPFSAGSDSDIVVTLNRELANANVNYLAINVTKSGFQINMDFSSTDTFTYIAVNGAYL